MNERRIEKRYEIDYRTDKKVKPCSKKTAKALEQYKERQYISKLLLMAERNCNMTQRNLCRALEIFQFQKVRLVDTFSSGGRTTSSISIPKGAIGRVLHTFLVVR